MDTDHIEMRIETLAGDIRDALLTHVRSMPEVWPKLSEQAQQEKIDSIEAIAQELVRRAVGMVAASGFDTLHITLKDFGVKGGAIKGKFEASAIAKNVLALADHENARAVVVLADPGAYMGEGAPAFAEPDEPELPDISEPEIPDLPPELDRRNTAGAALAAKL